MPSNQTPLGALPSRFRRERVLIVGCGDVGLRVARRLQPRMQLLALTSSPGRCAELRQQGIVPLVGNLDVPATLARVAGLATRVVHMAPPPTDLETQWWTDPRTRALSRVLSRRTPPRSLVYGSTSGVYGDCRGAIVAESRPVRPGTPRAQRRVDAEREMRRFGRVAGTQVRILRIPGIYALDRPGGTPRERLLKGTPVLQAPEDVYTNHIHADDLANATATALWRGGPQRVFHVSDNTRLKMGAYFDVAADIFGLPRPPRVARGEARERLPLMLLSFMNESRRMSNERLRKELRVRLRYPTVRDGLRGRARK